MCESVICRTCNGYVFEENAIFCDICRSWFHLNCTKLDRKSLGSYGLSELPWYCVLCVQLPFASVSDRAVRAYSFNSCQYFSCKGSCSYCKRTIKESDKTLLCKLSKHYVHLSCERTVRQNMTTESRVWSCTNCYVFPFDSLDQEDFLEINSIFDDNVNHLNLQNLPLFDIPKVFANSINDFLSDSDSDVSEVCKYYSVESFNKMQEEKKNFLSVFHTNIRSLNKNFECLENFLSNLESKFDIVSLSETWAATRSKLSKKLILSGYHPIEEIAGYSQNSGCGVYIINNLNYKLRTDLNCKFKNDDEEFQSLWVEIINNKRKNLVFAVLYRHPKSNKNKLFSNHLKIGFVLYQMTQRT